MSQRARVPNQFLFRLETCTMTSYTPGFNLFAITWTVQHWVFLQKTVNRGLNISRDVLILFFMFWSSNRQLIQCNTSSFFF